MNKILLTTALFILLMAGSLLAQQPAQSITLKDGTTIKGQLISVANGSYTIATPTMGQVKVSSEQILSITSADANNNTQTTNTATISQQDFKSLQTNMMQDPQIMSLIQDLIQDPQIAELMKNPTLMQDALSMDPQKIQNNPQMQQLMQNPTVQKIIAITADKVQK